MGIVGPKKRKYLGAFGYEKIGSPQDSEVCGQNKWKVELLCIKNNWWWWEGTEKRE